MRADELKTKDDAELKYDLKERRRELFNLRMRGTLEGNSNPSKIGDTRRTIARILTILRERQLQIHGQKSRIK